MVYSVDKGSKNIWQSCLSYKIIHSNELPSLRAEHDNNLQEAYVTSCSGQHMDSLSLAKACFGVL